MAKKNKESFAEMFKKLTDNAAQTRVIETKEERRYFLIVCEGTRTEPIYFEYLKQFLPKHLLETIQIIGQGDNTINIVKTAIIERDKRIEDEINPNFDEVWAVFDKDDFPNVRFNSAVRMAEEHGIESGHSNQAFELWYVLHFNYLDTAINRQDYFRILSEILKIKYKKNNKDIVARLFEGGDIKHAIECAKKLETMHKGKTPSNSHPSTRIHVLVEKLLAYSNPKLLADD
jgi:hypothetical protein